MADSGHQSQLRIPIVVDFDGTLAPNEWPSHPTSLMPGAADAVRRFRDAGHPVVINSCRLAPRDPKGRQRPPAEVEAEIAWMRGFLDGHGLGFVQIHTEPGKPGAGAYLDDKAERYNPGPKSWARLADRVLLRLGNDIQEVSS